MTRASAASTQRSKRSKLDPQLDALLERRAEAVQVIVEATARRDATIKTAKETFTEEVGTAPTDLDLIDEELAAFMERHHFSLVRRLTRTIKRATGTVYVVLRAKEVDFPADLQSLSWMLFEDQEGEDLLKPYVPEVDKKALAAAIKNGSLSPRLTKRLRGAGVGFGRHLTFLVKSPAEDNAVTISRRMYTPRARS